ncbi:MAG: response regulator [Flavipsychrobacter sp.]|nr:response regulator [Flavipsychrobacter sp.]
MKDLHILLVEDNEGDIILTREALREISAVKDISVVKDGREAIHFLFKTGSHENAPVPDLVLLDINLPKVDGKEVLKTIKQDPSLRKLPVIVLTTSASEKDIIDAYTHYANCYITKPVDYSSFMKVIQSVESFWMQTAQLPNS